MEAIEAVFCFPVNIIEPSQCEKLYLLGIVVCVGFFSCVDFFSCVGCVGFFGCVGSCTCVGCIFL